MRGRSLCSALLVLVLLSSAGCSLFGSQQRQPETTQQQIDNAVKAQLATAEMQEKIRQAVAIDQLQPTMIKLLEGEQAKTLVRKALEEVLADEAFKAKLNEALTKAIQSQDFQQQMVMRIQKVMMDVIEKGAAAAGKSGQSGGGDGGGSSGGTSSGGTGGTK